MAVVLLCLAYVERELAAQLYAAGWERAKKSPLVAVLERGYEDGVLSELLEPHVIVPERLRQREEPLQGVLRPVEPHLYGCW